MATSNIFNLKKVDYSVRGQRIEIIVDSVPKKQTVIFTGIDCFGETCYFMEESLRYITQIHDSIDFGKDLSCTILTKFPRFLKLR